ncbi:hypothetical protein [Paenibacillus sp. KS-LC4]|uniref:hypothetical protein n=1 Tax=Paenibacillus sp. KS-LC4 TaxID=2979727 RepID=UPI0030D0E854
MKKRSATLFVLVLAMSLMLSLTASASTIVAAYGNTYSDTLAVGQTSAYFLSNAKTSGTSVKVTAAAANAIQLHYYWTYNNTTLDLGTYIVNSTNYSGGASFTQQWSLLILVS